MMEKRLRTKKLQEAGGESFDCNHAAVSQVHSDATEIKSATAATQVVGSVKYHPCAEEKGTSKSQVFQRKRNNLHQLCFNYQDTIKM